MTRQTVHDASAVESRQVAEAARQKEWLKPSFLRDLYLGRFRFEMIHPFPGLDAPERPDYARFREQLKQYFLDHVDPLEVDATGEFPEDFIERLNELGALGMNIPAEYGGMGFSKTEYCQTSTLSASYEGSVFGFLSPHQSVGVPECLKLFGTEAQKQKYLAQCANGAVSAFALTESDVGSDPARVTATLETTADGDAYLLNGRKVWCTNGTVAKLLVVVARHRETGKLSAVLVETEWAGVEVEHRCRFMGMSALQNAVIGFENVRVPKENLIGKEGQGLRIALTALNTGRLSVPYAVLGVAKKALEVARTWAASRVQWGKPIGEHEAVALKLAEMAAKVYGMEAVVDLACRLTDSHEFDVRLEAAAAKEWNSCRVWEILDDTIQILGGRGYEKESSLLARSERAYPSERLMRDWRVARIFEGSSEIMHLLMAREAVDKHLEVAGDLVEPAQPWASRAAALPRAAFFYVRWYPAQWLGWRGRFGYGEFGRFAGHLRFINRAARKLARQIFYGMLYHGAALENRQGFLFRWVDAAMELHVMSSGISRALTLQSLGEPEAETAIETADLLCRIGRRKVEQLVRGLWHNEDAAKRQFAGGVLAGRYTALESGIITLEEAEAAQTVLRNNGCGSYAEIARKIAD